MMFTLNSYKRWNADRADPTRTGALRRAFLVELRRRFKRVQRMILEHVGKEDAFGLTENVRMCWGKPCSEGATEASYDPEPLPVKPSLLSKIKDKVAAKYAKLEQRYGPKYAKAIIGATLAGIPIPGGSLAPLLLTGVAEVHRRLRPAPVGNVWTDESREAAAAARKQKALSKGDVEKLHGWRESLWHRGHVTRLAQKTSAGGELEHLHPGEIEVYRGHPPGSKRPSQVKGLSYTKSKAVAKRWAEGGAVETLRLTKSIGAIDVGKALKGIPSKSEHEQEVFVVHNVGNEEPELTEADIQRLAKQFLDELHEEHKDEPVANATPRFDFMSNPEAAKAFQVWVKRLLQSEIVGKTEDELWKRFVKEAFNKGAGRSWEDVKRAAIKPGEAPLMDPESGWGKLSDFYQGSKDEFLRTSFMRPVGIEKVKVLAHRAFTDLSGVTDSMATKMSRSLLDGFIQGTHPMTLAKSMAEEVGIGLSRAQTIARTEISRAYVEGQLDAFEQLGVQKLGVMVEWQTRAAGYPDQYEEMRICELCQDLEGIVLDIDEAHGMFPRHPNCGCVLVSANVGEDEEDQVRSKSGIDRAIKRSVKREGGSDRSTWFGADAEIAKQRPQSVITSNSFFEECERDEHGRCVAAGHVEPDTLREHLKSDGNGRLGTKDLGETNVIAYRVGEVSDRHGRGVFFAGEKEGAEAYAKLHPGHEVKAYKVKLKKPLLAGHQNDVTIRLFGKSYGEMHDKLNTTKGGGAVVAGRKLDVKIAKEAKRQGYDSIVYMKPAAPAKTEVAVLTSKPTSKPTINARNYVPAKHWRQVCNCGGVGGKPGPCPETNVKQIGDKAGGGYLLRKERVATPQLAEAEFKKALRISYPRGIPIYHEAPIGALESIRKSGLTSTESAENTNFGTVGEPSGFVSGDKVIVKFRVPATHHDKLSPDQRYDPSNAHADLLKEHKGVKGADVSYDGQVPLSMIESIHIVRDGKVVTNVLNCGGKGGKPGPCKSSSGVFTGDDHIGAALLSKGSDGREHAVMTGPDGTVVAEFSGTEEQLDPHEAGHGKLLSTKGAEIHFHHNHPQEAPLSPGDIMTAATQAGTRAITAYTPGGESHTATMIDDKRDQLHSRAKELFTGLHGKLKDEMLDRTDFSPTKADKVKFKEDLHKGQGAVLQQLADEGLMGYHISKIGKEQV